MVNHFSRLGLPTQFELSAADLDTVYLRLSSETHPDRLGEANNAERSAALLRSAEINESYRILKDPFQRAEHLLALLGGPSAESDKRTPPDFLEEVLELRQELDDALAEGDLATADALVPQLAAQRDRLLDDVAKMFAQPAPQNLSLIRLCLNAANYFRRMLQQIRDARLTGR